MGHQAADGLDMSASGTRRWPRAVLGRVAAVTGERWVTGDGDEGGVAISMALGRGQQAVLILRDMHQAHPVHMGNTKS